MIRKLKRKIKEEGRTLKWFINKYLPDHNYSTVMLQINEFSGLQDYTKEAIIEYLEDK